MSAQSTFAASNLAAPNLASLLHDHPFADHRPLFCTVDREVTAGTARREARDLAAALRVAGVEAGEAVGVQLPNDPSYVIAMMAIWSIGAVFIPINARAPEAEVQGGFVATAPRALIDASGVRLLPGAARRYDPGVAFATFTSGTTGRPKAILHTHRSYFELIDRVLGPLRGAASNAAPKTPTPNLIPVSLALNAGIYNVLFGLRAGAAIVIMDRFDTRVFATLVARYQIRSTVLPPAAMAMLNDDTSVSSLAPLRYLRSITAPLSPLQATRFRDRFGVAVLNSYGQAEMGEVIGWTAADAKDHPDKLGAAGRPLPKVAVRLDPQTSELLVKPPAMATGYATGEELHDRVEADGFVRTGDIARIDEDGFVWIEGRVSDMINRGGNKIFPDQVEEVLRLSPNVRDVAVVGRPDERLGEVPVAFVVADRPFDAAELEALCRQHLAPYKVPVEFRAVERIPRTDVGKVLRRQLL